MASNYLSWNDIKSPTSSLRYRSLQSETEKSQERRQARIYFWFSRCRSQSPSPGPTWTIVLLVLPLSQEPCYICNSILHMLASGKQFHQARRKPDSITFVVRSISAKGQGRTGSRDNDIRAVHPGLASTPSRSEPLSSPKLAAGTESSSRTW